MPRLLVICHKTRERPNEVADMKVIGDVEGKNVVIVDDMIDTAGTICKASSILKEKGALSVRAVEFRFGLALGNECLFGKHRIYHLHDFILARQSHLFRQLP